VVLRHCARKGDTEARIGKPAAESIGATIREVPLMTSERSQNKCVFLTHLVGINLVRGHLMFVTLRQSPLIS
jgi:hypothetical protein